MLRLLSRLTQKASATTRLQVQAVRGQHAIWTPRRFDQLISEGYEQAVWVYACVTWLTRMAKGTRWMVLVNDDEAPSTHPLLRLMNRPNDIQSGAAFLESAYGYWLTAGNAYIERVGPRGFPPVELWVKRPDRMRVIPHPTRLIGGYQYEVAGRKHEFDAWQIKHLKTWAPLDDWYGMSPLAAAARGIDVFNAGQAHNLALIQNGARPTGAWVNQGSLTDDQFRNLREQIDDATRTSNRGRPILLEGGTTWQEMGLSPRDLDFLAGQTDAARQIHAAYGVHPVVTGLATGTFENQAQAQRSALINAVLPFLDQFVAEMNEWIAPTYGENVALAYDRDAFPAMSEDQESLWKRATMGFTRGFVTRDEARVMVGFDAIGGERGDVFSDEITARAAPALDPEADVDDEPDDEEPEETRAHKVRALSTPKLQAEYWRARVDLQEAWEPTLERVARRAFEAERAELREALATAEDATSALALVESVVTPARWAALEPAWLAAMTAGGRDALQQITGKSHTLKVDATDFAVFREVFGFAFEGTLARAHAHIPRISGLISTTTLESLRDLIGSAARAGLSINDLADQIDTLYLEQIIPNRSVVIARTEVISATNYGSQAAAEGTGLDLEKVWLTALDGRQRQSHDEANGQRVPLNGKFVVGGHPLAHPGDMDGPIEEIVQCFPGETLVDDGVAEVSIRSWYEGEVVTIETASGKHLTGTPNHPILTRRGWVPLAQLDVGDEVVEDARAGRNPGLEPQVVHVQTVSLRDVHAALTEVGARVRANGAALNLHGRLADKDVDVVAADGRLLANREPAVREQGGDVVLEPADVRATALAAVGNGAQRSLVLRNPATRGMSGGDLATALVGGHGTPLEGLGGASAAEGNAGPPQDARDGRAGQAVALAEGVDADAGFVRAHDGAGDVRVAPVGGGANPGGGAFTEVRRLTASTFAGHVYTLQTATGWYVANGIIARNCRCTQFYEEVNP